MSITLKIVINIPDIVWAIEPNLDILQEYHEGLQLLKQYLVWITEHSLLTIKKVIQKVLSLTQICHTHFTFIWASTVQELRQKSELVFLVCCQNRNV